MTRLISAPALGGKKKRICDGKQGVLVKAAVLCRVKATKMRNYYSKDVRAHTEIRRSLVARCQTHG